MKLTEKLQLNNGIEIPRIGLGVWKCDQKTEFAIHEALKAGYRMIDTAKRYGNESETGKTINKEPIERKDIFVTTKVWVDAVKEKTVKEEFRKSLISMELDYVDLLLIHWPVEGFVDAYLTLEELYREGSVRAIGVSNFKKHHLEELMGSTTIVPAVNQIEYNLQNQDEALVLFCQEHHITVEAFSPLARGESLFEENLISIAAKYQKSSAQIILRWMIQKNIIPLPKSVHTDRIKENIDIFDFEIVEEDMHYLNSLNRNKRIAADPDECDKYFFK